MALLKEVSASTKKFTKIKNVIMERNETVRPLLKQVWEAFDRGETVNGVTFKEAWARNAGITKRQINHILNGRKDRNGNRGSRSTFLTRIADAKEKLAEVYRQINAPYKDGEARNHKALYDEIDPILDPLYREFLTLIAPDGYEVFRARNGWSVQEKFDAEETADSLPATDSATETEEHTGQHEDCLECFNAQKLLEKVRSAAGAEWQKRVNSLIRQWRECRIKNADKYRAEFEKAAAKYEKRVGDYAKASILDGRGRMEAAIATQGVNSPSMKPTVTVTVKDECPDYTPEQAKALFEETN